MKYTWRHVIKHVLFGIHSPSLLYVGQCWCQRKGSSPQAIKAAIRRSAERAYRTWGE